MSPRLWIQAGVALAPPVALVLSLVGLPLLDALVLPTLLVLLPCLGVAQRALLDPEVPLERIPVYASSAVAVGVLGALGAALGMRAGGAWAVGLLPLPWEELVAWSVGLTVAAGLVIALSLPVGRALGLGEHPVLRELLPRTAAEKVAFAGLSVMAGIGEELAYRGYPLALLEPLLGPWGTVLVAAVPFGMLHAYQGPVGSARTALIGVLFGGSVVLTGSLVPAIAAHAAVDLVAGLLLGERLLAASGERR